MPSKIHIKFASDVLVYDDMKNKTIPVAQSSNVLFLNRGTCNHHQDESQQKKNSNNKTQTTDSNETCRVL